MTRFALLALVLVGGGLAHAAGPGAPATLRVLSYNIHHGEGTDGRIDLPRLAGVIQAANPDLVALQEVDRKTRRAGGVDQAAELARLTGLFGRFGRQIDYDGGEYGQAVLSRFPIESSAIHMLPGEPDRERRLAFEVHVNALGSTLRFVSTHLHHANPALRERQAARLNELFADGDAPVLLAGDLNATPESPPLRILRESWTLAAAASPPRPTFPATNPDRTIDHVLIKKPAPLRLVSVQVLDAPLESDHRPLLVVFERPPQ